MYRRDIVVDDINCECNDQWGTKKTPAVTEQQQHKAKHTILLPITKRNPGKEQKEQAVSVDHRLLIIP